MSRASDSNALERLKEQLLTMAGYAEAAVNASVKALVRRDDEMARETGAGDDLIDRLELEIDEAALRLLGGRPSPSDLRFITAAMKISHNLERVGDEATTISRRVIALVGEPEVAQVAEVPGLAAVVLGMLKDALDAFVSGRVDQALGVIPRDREADAINRRIQGALAEAMMAKPASVPRCLNLMVISKSLERIGDHATNVAEDVVYLYEGRDIRHADLFREKESEA